MFERFQTLGVLAGAYDRGARRRVWKAEAAKAGAPTHQMLSHTVEFNEERRPIRVLCGRVALDSMSDVGGLNPETGELDTSCKPSCSRCLKKDPRWNAPAGSAV